MRLILHTTKYHDKQLRNAALFRLPAHHLRYITAGKVYQAATVAGAIVTLPGALSQLCPRVADMSPTSPNVAKSWPTLCVVATQKRPRHTQFMSLQPTSTSQSKHTS